MRVLVASLALLLLISSASALTLTVSGGCKDRTVTVTTDTEATIIFRMNSGTPIFSKSSPSTPAHFLPRVTGELSITAIAGSEKVSKTLSITACPTSSGGTVQRNILPSGTFEVLGKEVRWRTAYGALKKASEIYGFTIVPELTDWGIFVKCIKGVCNGDIGETSGWMYWVNYPDSTLPGVAATEYAVYPGDEIVWYFSRGMTETPETSPYKIRIEIDDDYGIRVSITWPSKVPPIADFTYTPSNPVVGETITFNASKSADDGQITNYVWNFGDGDSAEGVEVTHSYSQPGSYEVTLTVFDNDGLSDTRVKTVNVSEPAIEVSTNQTIVVGPGQTEITVHGNLSLTGIVLKSDWPVRITISDAPSPPGVVYGTFYECFRIETNRSVEANISFKVPKEISNVVLMKYNGSWYELPTTKICEDGNFTYYMARTTTFSVFAITIKWENFPLNSSDERIQRALNWLKSIQSDDGGFGSPGDEGRVGKTSWAIMAIVAAGQDPHEWKKNGYSPIDFIRKNLKDELGRMGTADYARTILALVYADEDPRTFAGVNLVELLKSKVKENGQIGDFVYTTIWGILALKASGEDVTLSAEWLKSQQNPDGGFSWAVGKESDFDDTAAAIQALIAAGEPKDSEVIERALGYLKEGQNDDGGMKYIGSSASNAASDAWTIQALVAAGVNPAEWRKNNISVVEHLLSLQTAEGYFNYTSIQKSNPGYMTVSAIMALLGKPHPIKEVQAAATAVTTTTTVTATTTATTTTTTATTTTATTTSTAVKRTPGFTAVAAVAVLLIIATGLRRWK